MSIISPLPEDPRPVAVSRETRTYEVRIIVGRGETPVVIGSREDYLLDSAGVPIAPPARRHFVRRDFTTEFLEANPTMVALMQTIADTMDAWEAEDVVAANLAAGLSVTTGPPSDEYLAMVRAAAAAAVVSPPVLPV